MLLPFLALAAPQFAVLKRIPLPGDEGWDYLTVRHDEHRLYIARATHVQVMDTRSGALVTDIPNVPGAHGVALAPEYHIGLATSGTTNAVVAFDADNGAEIKRIPVGEKPDAVVYDRRTQRFVVMNGDGHSASIVHPIDLFVTATIPLGGAPEFAAPDGRGSVFVNLEDASRVERIDLGRRKVVQSWSLAPGESPSGLAYDPDRKLVFSACDDGLMTVLDPRRGSVRTVPIGKGPDAAAFDPKLGLAFSSNGADGTLTVVRAKDLAPVQTLATGPGARTMALDPEDHRIYLVARGEKGVEILVVGRS